MVDNDPKGQQPPRRTPTLDDFLVEPTRDLTDWQWLWRGDHRFPLRSHRGLLGRLIVFWKRLFGPFVKPAQQDLWDRQRTFNLILLEHLVRGEEHRDDHRRRLEYLEALDSEGIQEIMRHNDALFARAGTKLHNLVGPPHQLFFVLDDDHSVAALLQPLDRQVVLSALQVDDAQQVQRLGPLGFGAEHLLIQLLGARQITFAMMLPAGFQ